MASKKRRKKAGKRTGKIKASKRPRRKKGGKKRSGKKRAGKKRAGKKRAGKKAGKKSRLVRFTRRPAFIYLGTRDEAVAMLENAVHAKPGKATKRDLCDEVLKSLLGTSYPKPRARRRKSR